VTILLIFGKLATAPIAARRREARALAKILKSHLATQKSSRTQFTMTHSTENVTLSKSIKSRNSNPSLQIQIKSNFEIVPRDEETSEFLDLVDFGHLKFAVVKFLATNSNQIKF